MTVAELKRRLYVGRKLLLVRTLYGPTQKQREVYRVRSNSIIMKTEKDTESYLDIPKAKFVKETDNGFQFLCEDTGSVAVEYQWID